jgi:hypothetical protein
MPGMCKLRPCCMRQYELDVLVWMRFKVLLDIWAVKQ